MTEAPPFPRWVTVLLAIWAAIGPLAGLLIGHYLVRSWDQKRWLADNCKEEYRGLLAALHKLNSLMIAIHKNGLVNPKLIDEAFEETSTAFNTIMFSSDFFEQSKVADDVIQACRKFINDGSFDDYYREYGDAVNLIRAAARKSAP